MSAHLTLVDGSAIHTVPILNLVAAWKTLYEYAQPGMVNPDTERWRSASFTWLAENRSDGRVVLQSIEVLCRTVADVATWNIEHDPAFRERNRQWLAAEQNGASLTAAALAVWDCAAPAIRSALIGEVDGRVFSLVVAHGTAGD
ncbi:MAG: hypothetical protein WA924_15370 [Burkholderiaceae bacterium]